MKKHVFSAFAAVLLLCAGSSVFAVPRAIPVQSASPVARAIAAPTGPKKMVAVAKFENKSGWVGDWNLGTGMTEQLTDALMQSGQFIVLERQDIGAVLTEQDFAATGRTTKEGGAKIGKINRAQILIKGAITEFSSQTSGGHDAFRINNFSLGSSSSSAHVAVIIYMIDSTTGQVLQSQRCEGKAEAGGLSFSYSDPDFAFGTSGFKKTPMGKAVQMAIDQAVVFISRRMANVPWTGKIVLAKPNGDVYINAGRTAGIMPGDQFSVFQLGEELIDPDSGLDLGSEETMIGKVEVSKVQEKYSIAIPVSGTGFAKGDAVKFDG